MAHIPVMVPEVLRYLLHGDSKLVLDGTIGCGGHAEAILEQDPEVRLIGIDCDQLALRIARRRLERYRDRVKLLGGSYAELGVFLGPHEKVDGAILDLGICSIQLEEASRGFSYARAGPLDMRMGAGGRTARELIEGSSVDELARILRGYGEVRGAEEVARAIKDRSKSGKMRTTLDLRRAVERVMGSETTPGSLSRVFQSLRIAVNRELENLETFLDKIIDFMNPNARLVFISYHSFEDRLVKQFFKRESSSCLCPPGTPVCVCHHRAKLEIMTKRAVKTPRGEAEQNPRSRSARLRAARVLGGGSA